MAPNTGMTYAISVTEQARMTQEYGRPPQIGDTYLADEDADKVSETGLYAIAGGELRKVVTGDRVVPRVVVSGEVAHRLEVGRRELIRRKRRQSFRAESGHG